MAADPVGRSSTDNVYPEHSSGAPRVLAPWHAARDTHPARYCKRRRRHHSMGSDREGPRAAAGKRRLMFRSNKFTHRPRTPWATGARDSRGPH